MKEQIILPVFEDLKAELVGWDVCSTAEAAGVSDQTIYNWLVGKTRKPRLDTITKVASAIGFELRLARKATQLKSVA